MRLVRRSLVPIALLGVFVGAACGYGALVRWRQAGRERELVLSWVRLGQGLVAASSRLGLDAAKAPEPWDLSSAPVDSVVRRRVDTLEATVWKDLERRRHEKGLDSLQEALRRSRERAGLALAHCREGTRSAPSKWFLAGYPER
jgi:hypothetical protein